MTIPELTELIARRREQIAQLEAYTREQMATTIQGWEARAAGHPHEEEIRALIALVGMHDWEKSHSEADELLLAIIGDPLVNEVFEAIGRWYA